MLNLHPLRINSTFIVDELALFIKLINCFELSIFLLLTSNKTSPNCIPATFAGLNSLPSSVSTLENPTTRTPSVDNFIPTLAPPGYNFISSNFCTATDFIGISPRKSILTLSLFNLAVFKIPWFCTEISETSILSFMYIFSGNCKTLMYAINAKIAIGVIIILKYFNIFLIILSPPCLLTLIFPLYFLYML